MKKETKYRANITAGASWIITKCPKCNEGSRNLHQTKWKYTPGTCEKCFHQWIIKRGET